MRRRLHPVKGPRGAGRRARRTRRRAMIRGDSWRCLWICVIAIANKASASPAGPGGAASNASQAQPREAAQKRSQQRLESLGIAQPALEAQPATPRKPCPTPQSA